MPQTKQHHFQTNPVSRPLLRDAPGLSLSPFLLLVSTIVDILVRQEVKHIDLELIVLLSQDFVSNVVQRHERLRHCHPLLQDTFNGHVFLLQLRCLFVGFVISSVDVSN
jgi:hypothetical protein